MKKILALLLAFVLCLSLCACGKTDATKAVEAQIAALTDITYEDRDAVAAARSAYEALTQEEQEKVDNLSQLGLAEDTIRKLVKAMEDEANTQADQILENYSAEEAMPLLRELYQTSYVQSKRKTLANNILKNYILFNGVQTNSIGNPETDGMYRTVSMKVYGEHYYLMLETDDSSSLKLMKEEPYPTNRLVDESEYTLYSRHTNIYAIKGYVSYYKTEYFRTGYYFSDYFDVSWDTRVDTENPGQNLSRMPAEMDVSDYRYWPYLEDKSYMEANSVVNVAGFIDEIDDCLEVAGLPITAWEVLGIFE